MNENFFLTRYRGEHQLNIWGHDIRVSDFATSSSAQFTKVDMEEDPFFAKNLSPAPKVILDIGANIGVFSIIMARQYPESKIIAVECAPHNYYSLLSNLSGNNIKNVTPIQAAVYSERGKVEMYQSPSNSGEFSAYMPAAIRNEELKMSVNAVLLDDIMDGIKEPTIDYLKIDIEGCEYETLRAFTKWDRIKYMHIELHRLCDGDEKEALKLQDGLYEFICSHMGKENVTAVYDHWKIKHRGQDLGFGK